MEIKYLLLQIWLHCQLELPLIVDIWLLPNLLFVTTISYCDVYTLIDLLLVDSGHTALQRVDGCCHGYVLIRREGARRGQHVYSLTLLRHIPESIDPSCCTTSISFLSLRHIRIGVKCCWIVFDRVLLKPLSLHLLSPKCSLCFLALLTPGLS